jgi:hypothetical protein
MMANTGPVYYNDTNITFGNDQVEPLTGTGSDVILGVFWELY